MAKVKGRRMRPSEVPTKTIHDADELISFMVGGGVLLGERGVEFVGAGTTYYDKPTINASVIYDISKNNYVTEQIVRLKSLLFITPPTVVVRDPDEKENEDLSDELMAVWDSPDVDGWTKLQQAWVDMFVWGCAIFNPVWRREGARRVLVKLRRLPPESFSEPPKERRLIYSQILRGITLDEAGNLECWQTQSDNEPHLLKNVMLLKDPTHSPLAGESQVAPIVPIVRALDFAWQAQRQKLNRIGAPIVFIAWKAPPVKTADRDDIKHAKTILQNWGKGTAFMLRDNMEIVKLEFNDNQSAIQTIQQLERRIREYFSPSTIIQGQGQTISESGGAKVEMVSEWLRGQHNMMEGIFERLLQDMLAENAYDGYLVEIEIPEPTPDRQLTMAMAKVGFDTKTLFKNEIREYLGKDALSDEELAKLEEEYPAPPPSPFGSPFGAPSRPRPPEGEASFVAHTQEPEHAHELEYELVQADRRLTDRIIKALRNEPQVRREANPPPEQTSTNAEVI